MEAGWAIPMNSFWRSSVAVARSSGFLTRHLQEKKLLYFYLNHHNIGQENDTATFSQKTQPVTQWLTWYTGLISHFSISPEGQCIFHTTSWHTNQITIFKGKPVNTNEWILIRDCKGLKTTKRKLIFISLCVIEYLETKSMNSGDHWSGSRKDGGGLVGIMNIALIGWISP
jgi:hypothetical protein